MHSCPQPPQSIPTCQIAQSESVAFQPFDFLQALRPVGLRVCRPIRRVWGARSTLLVPDPRTSLHIPPPLLLQACGEDLRRGTSFWDHFSSEPHEDGSAALRSPGSQSLHTSRGPAWGGSHGGTSFTGRPCGAATSAGAAASSAATSSASLGVSSRDAAWEAHMQAVRAGSCFEAEVVPAGSGLRVVLCFRCVPAAQLRACEDASPLPLGLHGTNSISCAADCTRSASHAALGAALRARDEEGSEAAP